MKRLPTQLLALLSFAVMAITVSEAAFAQSNRPTRKPPTRPPVSVDRPFCYIEIPGQGIRSLDRECKVETGSLKLIDLSIDRNQDGVSDELLAEMRKFDQDMRNVKSPEDFERTMQRFESRLPYSSQVRQLQAQQRQLQQYLGTVRSETQMQLVYRQLESIQQRIYQDPSYTRVQQAMNKVYSVIHKRR
ncbi:hypothetical protein [Alkalinema sp. FACHB-956]|uniref:hypothetical protein n=1 Tax=Alkalinema sp. FACHB-956 TaxID=2692768 RepID=UPI001685B052|nr:hypothetical protein [Alkalinema sp. FACHB-956]MBD2326829.1 hypothetical protein [Alkalinema sp. FACHB-956]